MSEATGHGDHHDNGMGHAVPWPILVGVFLSLMGLTFLTVAVTYVDLGPLNIVIALGIATIKAAIVVLFFMHLFWDKPLNSIVFVLTIAFVGVFLAFTIIDTKQYQPAIAQLNADVAAVKNAESGAGGAGAVGGTWAMPKLEQEEEDMVKKIKAIAEPGGGDAAAGKAVFAQFCGVCHKLEGEGKDIGPDLADFDRLNLDRLIVSIAYPSKEIRQGYDNYNVRTKSDGPKIGIKSAEDAESITLKMADGSTLVIKKSDIKGDVKKLPVSLMPDGLFDGKTEDDIRNLMEYLKSVPIVAAPKPAAAPAPAVPAPAPAPAK